MISVVNILSSVSFISPIHISEINRPRYILGVWRILKHDVGLFGGMFEFGDGILRRRQDFRDCSEGFHIIYSKR